jgi:hypothetical protein
MKRQPKKVERGLAGKVYLRLVSAAMWVFRDEWWGKDLKGILGAMR